MELPRKMKIYIHSIVVNMSMLIQKLRTLAYSSCDKARLIHLQRQVFFVKHDIVIFERSGVCCFGCVIGKFWHADLVYIYLNFLIRYSLLYIVDQFQFLTLLGNLGMSRIIVMRQQCSSGYITTSTY